MTATTAAASDGGAPRNAGGSARLAAQKHSKFGDRVFVGLSSGAAWLILVILAGVAIFLIIKALPAITANWTEDAGLQDTTSGFTLGYENFWQYVAPLLFGTIWASLIALVMGAPVAIGIALFISHYAPRRISGVLGYLVDLLAAVPSVVFGLWGIVVIRPFLGPLNEFLNTNLGWIPLFSGDVAKGGSTLLAGAVVLAVMILPIITSISREIFLQTPSLHEEAALALGATKWEMIRLAVFPYARSGVVSAVLLGLGRALGETMAVAMIVSPKLIFSFELLTNDNPATIASNIANKFGGANEMQADALIATGLCLFIVSFAVNFLARGIIGRSDARKANRAARKTPRTAPQKTKAA